MAKNKKNRRNRRTPTQRAGQSRRANPTSANPQVGPPERAIENERKGAVALAVEESLDMSAAGDEPKPDGTDADVLWKMVQETRHVYDEARKRYESRNEELGVRAKKLDEQEQANTALGEQLDVRDSELAEERAALDKRVDEATEWEKTLSERETEVRKREFNAERGFTKERLEMQSQLDEARDSFRAGFAEKRQANEARLEERESALDEREDRLAEDTRHMEKEKRRLAYDQQDLEESRADLDTRVQQRAAAIREQLEHRIFSLEEQLAQARRDRDRHDEKLRHREDTDRKFGQRTTDEVLEELKALQTERDDLQAELARRPDADASARLEDLVRERESWQADRIELRRKASEYRQRLDRTNIDATQRETQRDLVASLEARVELLRKTNEELRAEVDDLHSRSEARTPFPACQVMDEDPEFVSEQPVDAESLELESFVEYLQHRIAATQPPLYYSISDIRSFVGGLAMGRLILLQGISGTGKTSLPVAFARAVGTQAAEIKVQAGWRDPQDLIGHYNTFEKRFHETEFLKALYRAGTPRWRDTIQVVLLDEMNLSHPEQYFSDLLSTLELPAEDQSLEIMTHAVAAAPGLLGEGKLRIPQNIWFVGTANHDETTMDFADKTYDRSHVMEFPTRPQQFEVQDVPVRRTISYRTLQNAFEEATRSHRGEAKRAINYLDSQVRDPLAQHFHIGWGPRLTRQMDRYVPVVVAAGGAVGEATDHLLAMRLLRKLQNRHDNRRQHVEALKQRIVETWSELDKKSEPTKKPKPTKSIDLLDRELRRLGHEPESDG